MLDPIISKHVKDIIQKYASGLFKDAFAFANRYLDETNMEKLLEVLRMTDLAEMLVEGAVEEAVEEAVNKNEIKIAKNLIQEGIDIETVSKATDLDESIIRNLQAEVLKARMA